ncbi:MAG: nuclear transport factor 2 family protein [Desulfarculus sp.]|nr:nuclear transport factor 2 family protein [Pseudomonadota bacterium]MBV1717076.1 nuclear transport factor 2 family protein [Desulfarculus sp.]MBU4575219.1 nuclear transport factor 2 family protein [Pseudomonadota bacterium]MBU4596364.1 nuclear transport factor 2 family protein [Pseudomonadota bacterium]MBV1737723.1 nuclear transport factor 2 family protein [Desulfarculus sp.]
MRRWLVTAALLAALLFPASSAPAAPADQAAQVVAAYFTTAAAEDIKAHLATRDLSPAQRPKAAEFAQGVWGKVETREVKVGKVEVALSPDGGQALARCKVSALVVNKESGESFAKQTAYVAVLVKREGQWKVRRMLPETVFRRVQNEQMMARQTQRLLDAADQSDTATPTVQAKPSETGAQQGRAEPAKPQNLGNIISSVVQEATSPPSMATQHRTDSPPDRQAFPPPAQQPRVDAPAPGGQGRVVRVERGTVFIDRGAANGLKPGQRLEVVSYREITHPVSGKTIRLPQRAALLLVREVWDSQARCLVLESAGELIPNLSVIPISASTGQ